MTDAISLGRTITFSQNRGASVVTTVLSEFTPQGVSFDPKNKRVIVTTAEFAHVVVAQGEGYREDMLPADAYEILKGRILEAEKISDVRK